MDWLVVLTSLLALLVIFGALYACHRATAARHHEHLLPSTPRAPRKGH
jgi:hypothetical protein